MKKKILSALLALSMVASLLPMSVCASTTMSGITSAKFRDHDLVTTETMSAGIAASAWKSTFETEVEQSITLSATEAKAGYQAKEKSKIVAAADYEVDAWLVPESKVVGTSYASDEDIESAMEGLSIIGDLDEKAIETGSCLVIKEKHTTDSSVKYYVAKLTVSPATSTKTATDIHVKGRGLSEMLGKSVILSNYEVKSEDENDADLRMVEKMTLSYEDAISNKQTKFEATGAAKVEVVRAEKDALSQTAKGVGSANDVAAAFAGGTKIDVPTTAAIEGVSEKEGAEFWLIGKVTAEDESYQYYVLWITVPGKGESATIKDARVISLKSSESGLAEKDYIKFDGNYEGSADIKNPAGLTATVPCSMTNEAGTREKVKLDQLKIDFAANGKDVTVSWAVARANGEAPSTADYNRNANKAVTVDRYVFDKAALSDKDALYLRVTAKDGQTEVTNYYVLTVKQEKGSNDVAIKAGTVVGNDGDAAHTAVLAGANGGTWDNPTKLLAEVPYDASGISKYSEMTVALTVDDDAEVKYIAEVSEKELTKNGDITALVPSSSEKVNSDGTKKATIDKDDNGAAPHGSNGLALGTVNYLYILVTAEDGTTTGVYELQIKMAKQGAQARVLGVIPTADGKAFEDYAIEGLDKPAGTAKTSPTELKVTLPAGSKSTGLSAVLTVSEGAKIEYNRDKSDFEGTGTKKTASIGDFNAGDLIYIDVTSGDTKTHGYYVLSIDLSELADKTPTDDVELQLSDGKVVINNGGNTAEALKAGVEGAKNLQILDKSGNDVTATAQKVGTGWKMVADGAEFDIVVMGDTNGDCNINSGDTVRVRNAVLDASTLAGLEAEAGDLNGNGKIDSGDAVILRQMILAQQ